MRLFLVLVAVLGLVVVEVEVAEACGVRLTVKSPGVKRSARRAAGTSQRTPKATGPRRDATPIATGGGESATATTAAPAAGDTPEPAAAPAPAPAPARAEVEPATRVEPTRTEPPTTDVPVRAAPAEPAVARAPAPRFHKQLGFAGGSSELSPAMTRKLDADARWLAANPDKTITIEGHASAVGSAEVNQQLSEARAAAVKDYLVEQGVDPGRIQVVGHGFERPAYQPASSPRNRRVELVVD